MIVHLEVHLFTQVLNTINQLSCQSFYIELIANSYVQSHGIVPVCSHKATGDILYINRIQNLRKQMNFEVNDHIDVFLLEGTEMDRAVNTYHDYISEQVQADELALSDAVSDGTDIDMESYTLTLSISKSER